MNGGFYSENDLSLNSDTVNVSGCDSNKIVIRKDGTAYVLYQSHSSDEAYQKKIAALSMIGMGSELK